MGRRIVTAIDIGTYQVRVVVCEHVRGKDKYFPKIIGVGFTESRGLRHGYIINQSDIVRSIRIAINQAEKASGIKIKKAFMSVGGVGLDEIRSKGELIIPRADGDITDLDIKSVLQKSEEAASLKISNKKIIHAIPLRYKVDGHILLSQHPEGLKGSKLEVESLFVTSFEQHLNDMIQAIESVGVDVEDVMASPLAASLVTLTKAQKIAGCVLANIGAETVSMVVFEDNMPLSLKIFPIGSTDITNDIALNLKISLEEAEQIKLGVITGASYTQKELDEIILSRLRDMFDLIEAHLKKIGKNGVLPAGIIITGGGSGVSTIDDLAKAALKLPSTVGSVRASEHTRSVIKDSSWAVAYGLCIWGLTSESDSLGIKIARKTRGSISNWIKQFLP
jgi:cell division protein FtsA